MIRNMEMRDKRTYLVHRDKHRLGTSVVESCVSVLEQVGFLLEADTMQLTISIDCFSAEGQVTETSRRF